MKSITHTITKARPATVLFRAASASPATHTRLTSSSSSSSSASIQATQVPPTGPESVRLPPMPRDHIPGLLPFSPWEDELLALVASHPIAMAFQQTHPGFHTTRAVLKPKPEFLSLNLTRSTLLGPGMLEANPFVFVDDAKGALVAFYRVGARLAGHRGILHGGMTAVLLDECLGRACFGRLERHIAVTAGLELEYKAPVRTGRFIVISARTVDVQGRKAWVEAEVSDAMDGEVLVAAKGLFIEPKWAAKMSSVV
ncbi:hypothetical protein TD95_004774 [Thielaviopsis punctulata]|uniref:Thioesterase domain-containing protein n=1 Tax=Thielaviopsis punctulata TaxID=72032 RepID=A0A0F4ZBS7_9PEZI|nr:hypothetical protein TD95_004774 [Thielaviopsis punctulata]